MPTPRRPFPLRPLATVLLLAGAASACRAQGGGAPSTQAPARPTLVVLVTVDQLRGDYLDRFERQLTGGFARLRREGTVFTQAHHDHAIPETAPGHATLLSGRFPARTGILLNEVGVADPEAPLLGGAPGSGASPHRFQGTTLLDWMKKADRRSRALSVAGKDRSAILPIGRAKEHVYWYAADGRFTTSRWYRESLPDWVLEFNRRDLARRRAGDAWTLLRPPADYPEADSVQLEGAGVDFTFPHRMPADSAMAAALLPRTPWLDEMVLALALDGVRALNLGGGPATDLLNVSLSATDAIGHTFGPDSREIHDQILRLDRALGAFVDSLHRLRDPARVVVVLTGDHGVAPIPELSARTVAPPPMRVDQDGILAPARALLRARGVDTAAIGATLGIVLMDREALSRGRVSPDSVLAEVEREARRTAGIARVDRLRALHEADHARDSVARRWAHQLPKDARIDLVLTLAPLSIWWTANVASHHAPYAYDTHVPLILHGAAFAARRVTTPVRTVDLAPTLAAMLGIEPGERVDGVVLGRDRE